MEISQIPVKFIFHSYSESSTFGRPGLGRSIPHQMAILQIPALLSNSYLADPLSNGDFTNSCEFHISFLLWELNIWQTRSWQIYPPPNGNFTDSCSTLKLHILADPLSNGNFTDSCPDSSHFMTAHISLLLWEINIWQTRSWQMYPHLSGNFTDCCSDNSYFILTLRAYHLADQVLAYLPPHQMAISQIPALTAHISWQLIFHSYSESSTFGRPGLGRCTPIWVAISEIAALTTLISFLLWELIIWQTRSWHIYPPIQ